MRMVPYMPLSATTMMTGRSYCTAVANSCPVIRKSPSPAKAITVRSGARPFHADRRRHAVAHRAGDRRELAAVAAIAPIAVHPDREVAGAVADHRVGGKPFT